MRRKLEIHYEWYYYHDAKKPLPEIYYPYLEMEATQQIITMMKKGYKMGEMVTTFAGERIKGIWKIIEKPIIRIEKR